MFKKLKLKLEQESIKTADVQEPSECTKASHTQQLSASTKTTNIQEPSTVLNTSHTQQLSFEKSTEVDISEVNDVNDTSISGVEESSPASVSIGTTSKRQNLAATVLKYGEEISLKNKEIVRLDEELTRLKAELDGRNDNLNSADSELNDLKRVNANLLQTVAVHGGTIAKLKADLETTNEKTVDFECIQEERSQLRNKLTNQEAANDELTNKVKLLQNELDCINKKLSSHDPSASSGGEQLKLKLQRAHSANKSLENQLASTTKELSTVSEENQKLKSIVEANKQQALDELLSVSQEESGLRLELSSTVQKLCLLEAQFKSQTSLLKEKQEYMSKMEAQLQSVNQEKRNLETEHQTKISELTRRCEALKANLDNEIQTSKSLKEQLDSIREDALDKQLDDEKQMTDLHEQLSSLRGDLRQLERTKKKEVDNLQTQLNKSQLTISDIQSNLGKTTEEYEDKIAQLQNKLAESHKFNLEQESVLKQNKRDSQDLQTKLELSEKERDDLLLRNADLSSKVEKIKMDHKSTLDSFELDRLNFQQQLDTAAQMDRSSKEQLSTLQTKIEELEEEVTAAEKLTADHQQATVNVDQLTIKLQQLEQTVNEKNRTIKMQQQTVNDLKKTIKRELKGQSSEVNGRTHTDQIDRVQSSPVLTELYDSPLEDNIPQTPTTSTSKAQNPVNIPSQQHRHEVNGFCGHKDVNFEYLKNVVFNFLVSRDTESIHLVKAIAVLLEFTPAEEKLLKETIEWKMSWWPSSKPKKKIRK